MELKTYFCCNKYKCVYVNPANAGHHKMKQ